jgi:hypothetical protein
MGFKSNGVEFRLDDEALYHYEAFKSGNVDVAEMRAEYSRLRQTANKRLKRMEGTKYEKSQTYLRNAGKYGTIDQISENASATADRMGLKGEARERYINSHIAHKLSDVYKFLIAKTGSIRGMQRVENQTIKTMHERGMTFITKDNLLEFGQYMEHLRALHNGKQFDSERAQELFGVAKKKGIDPMEIAQDFNFWKTRVDELSRQPKIQNAKKRTADEYRKLLEKESDR